MLEFESDGPCPIHRHAAWGGRRGNWVNIFKPIQTIGRLNEFKSRNKKKRGAMVDFDIGMQPGAGAGETGSIDLTPYKT